MPHLEPLGGPSTAIALRKYHVYWPEPASILGIITNAIGLSSKFHLRVLIADLDELLVDSWLLLDISNAQSYIEDSHLQRKHVQLSESYATSTPAMPDGGPMRYAAGRRGPDGLEQCCLYAVSVPLVQQHQEKSLQGMCLMRSVFSFLNNCPSSTNPPLTK